MIEAATAPTPDVESALPDKRQVAASFSRAATSYDAVAELQRMVGNALIERLPGELKPALWLDLGCGTGHFSRVLGSRFPTGDGVALDIAEGMLVRKTSSPATPSACHCATRRWI